MTDANQNTEPKKTEETKPAEPEIPKKDTVHELVNGEADPVSLATDFLVTKVSNAINALDDIR